MKTTEERAAYRLGVEDAARRLEDVISVLKSARNPTEQGLLTAKLLGDYTDFIRRLKIADQNPYRKLKNAQGR